MTPQPPPIATAAVRTTTLHMEPGQILWACLAPGCLLQATQGKVAIRLAPLATEGLPHRPSPMLLAEGEHLPSMDPHHATWVQLSSAVTGPAEIRIVEIAPKPVLGQAVWQFLRLAFAGRKSIRHGEAHGVARTTAASRFLEASR